jgi:hypothetical protein
MLDVVDPGTVPAYLPMRMRSPFLTSRELLAFLVDLALADGDDFRLHRLFLGRIGMMMPPFFISPVSSRFTRMRS